MTALKRKVRSIDRKAKLATELAGLMLPEGVPVTKIEDRAVKYMDLPVKEIEARLRRKKKK